MLFLKKESIPSTNGSGDFHGTKSKVEIKKNVNILFSHFFFIKVSTFMKLTHVTKHNKMSICYQIYEYVLFRFFTAHLPVKRIRVTQSKLEIQDNMSFSHLHNTHNIYETILVHFHHVNA